MLMFTPNPASGLTRSCSKVGGAFDTKVTKKKEKMGLTVLVSVLTTHKQSKNDGTNRSGWKVAKMYF